MGIWYHFQIFKLQNFQVEMNEFLTNLLDSSSMPWLTAILLGLLVSVSPCALATNITAIGFISRDIENHNRVFLNGIFYTLGRAVTYSLIALVLYFGADQLKLSGFFQRIGEKVIGPLLLLIGLLLLDFIVIKFPSFSKLTSKMENKKSWKSADVVLLGIVFALAFCPVSGVLYFGMLIPMTVASSTGFYLPLLFAVATGIPVIIVAWVLAYTISGIGGVYNKIKVFELWFRRITAVLFIVVGLYYVIRVYF
jgi:cytochrome c-type biogenesis protein